MSGRSSLQRKKSKQQEDILSKLPEAILQRIISFLPSIDAARTSILSKRWEYVWISSPNLIFNVSDEEDEEDVSEKDEEYDEDQEGIASFMTFVDRALFLRRSNVKLFSLESAKKLDELRLRGWITAIVRRNVEELNLQFHREELAASFELPHCLFVSVSLTKLRLSIDCKLKFPPTIYLSSLKHLILEHIFFPDTESLKNLISGCPMIETMSLLMCKWENVFSVSISAQKLWRLEITEQVYDEDLISSDVMIFGPSLRCFHYQGEFLNDFCLYDVPSLEEGKLDVADIQLWESRTFLPRLYKFLKGLSHVKKLSLSRGAIAALKCHADLLPNVPVFNNLSSLSYTSKIELDCTGLIKILQNSPCLETLRFEAGLILPAHCKKVKEILEPVPPCFSSSLKSIEILLDDSCEYQKLFLNAAGILLKKANVLEKLIVHLPMDKEKVIKDLIKLPRASRTCQLLFC